MTELQWLIKLLTQHKLSPSLKDLFIERIGEVEASLHKQVPRPLQPITMQAPSTQRLLEEMAQQTGSEVPVNNGIATPAAAQALAARQDAIRSAAKTEPGRTSPRKF